MLCYTAPRVTVQQVLQQQYVSFNQNSHVTKVFQRIRACRTAALGYHVYQCTVENCGHIKSQYHPSFIGTAGIAIALIVAQ